MKMVAQTGFIVALLSSVLLVPKGFAQSKGLKKITWGVTSLSASNWIPWVAKDAKIYEKNGLDVELILVKGSGQTSTSILGGSLFAAPVELNVLPTLRAGDHCTDRDCQDVDQPMIAPACLARISEPGEARC